MEGLQQQKPTQFLGAKVSLCKVSVFRSQSISRLLWCRVIRWCPDVTPMPSFATQVRFRRSPATAPRGAQKLKDEEKGIQTSCPITPRSMQFLFLCSCDARCHSMQWHLKHEGYKHGNAPPECERGARFCKSGSKFLGNELTDSEPPEENKTHLKLSPDVPRMRQEVLVVHLIFLISTDRPVSFALDFL